MTTEAAKANVSRFDINSRREGLLDRDDAIVTAMTYLRAAPITVITRAQLLSVLPAPRIRRD